MTTSNVTLDTTLQPLITGWSLFFLLWGAGMLGVVLLAFGGLKLPAEAVERMGAVPLRLLTIVQSGILLAAAVAAGNFAAQRVGLRAPLVQALLGGGDLFATLSSFLLPALLLGAAGAAVAIVVGKVMLPLLPAALADPTSQMIDLTLPLRLLYGGITEELLMRWGLMSGIAYLLWRVTGRSGDVPGSGLIWIAIFVAALLFGAGHLPFAASIVGRLTPLVVVYVVGLNAFLGVFFGWLFWQYGLSAAIIAHMMFHIVVVTATRLTG